MMFSHAFKYPFINDIYSSNFYKRCGTTPEGILGLIYVWYFWYIFKCMCFACWLTLPWKGSDERHF